MAKSLLRLKARALRKQGVSVKTIARTLEISRSTTSIWVRDIILTIEQLEQLQNSMLQGSERGRIKNAFLQKEKRRQLLVESKRIGAEKLANLTEREFLISGLALYWGEGGKKNRRVEFCNSDPKMIKFLLLWLQAHFNIKTEDLICAVGINEAHSEREQIVKAYWSEMIGIPIEQFRKTSFKKVTNKKIYENFNEHFGTLSVLVRKSSNLYFEIVGLIEGLYINMPG